MATPTLSGLTTIDDCENTTGWDTQIGGGAGAGVNSDVFIQGSASIGRRIDANDRGFGYDLGSGTEIDIQSGGAEEFDTIFFWVNILQPGGINSMRLRLSDNATDPASNWIEYRIFPDNPYSGGWFRASFTPAAHNFFETDKYWAESTFGAGANTRWIAFMFDMQNIGGTSPNCMIDIIHIGDKLLAVGGTTADKITWADIATADATAGYGIVQERSGVFFLTGTIQLGNSLTADCYFQDQDQILVWEKKLVGVDSAGTPTSIDANHPDYNALFIDQGSGITDFIDGTKSGTGDDASGVNGSLFQAAVVSGFNNRVTMNFNNETGSSVDGVELFGTTFKNILGSVFADASITFSSDATDGPNHEVSGCTFDNCGVVDPGRVSMQGNNFANTQQPDQFLDIIDVQRFDSGTTTFADRTAVTSSRTTNTVTYFSAPDTNDELYFGMNDEIAALQAEKGRSATDYTGGVAVWEYWNGSSWTALSGVTSTVTNGQHLLEGTISWTLPVDWARTTVNGGASLYYARMRITTQHTQQGITSWIKAEVVNGASMRWNANIDIANSQFGPNADSDANDNACGIEHTASGTETYTGLTFSGNDTDVCFTAATGNLTIEANDGSNPTTSVVTGSGTVTLNVNTVITLTGLIGTPATEVRVYTTGTTTELAGQENVTTGTFAFTLPSADFVDIRIHNVEYVYQALINFDLPAANTSIPIQQQFDRTYSNP
jgi:hypothetical protein